MRKVYEKTVRYLSIQYSEVHSFISGEENWNPGHQYTHVLQRIKGVAGDLLERRKRQQENKK